MGAACTLLGFEWDLPFRNFCQSVLGRFAGQRTSGALRTAAHTEQGADILCLYWNFPTHLNVEHQFYESSLLETSSLFALLALGSLCAVLILRYRGRGLFFICWGLLSLAPTLVVPLNVLVNEHRLYALIAAAGVALSLEWQGWRSHVKWALCGWVCVAAMLTQERNQVWRVSALSGRTRRAKVRAWPGLKYSSATPCEKPGKEDAKARYERALHIDPSQRSARTNLANIYLKLLGLTLRTGLPYSPAPKRTIYAFWKRSQIIEKRLPTWVASI